MSYPCIATNSLTPPSQPYYPPVAYHPPPSPARPRAPTAMAPLPNQPRMQNQAANQTRPQNYQDRKPLDPIPMSYTELLPHLIRSSLIVPCPMKPLEPPYPRGYDPNAKFDYHAGAVGHSTENCKVLKNKVQNLLDAKWLNFKEDSPNVGNNPLPGHESSGVNAIGESLGYHLIKKISNVKTPMKVIFEELCEFGGIKGLTETERSNDKEMKCGFHCSDEHSIEECDEFKQILQSMMDAHLIQISCESEGREVSMIEKSAVPRKQECTDVEPAVSTLPTEEQTTSMPKPLDIHYVKEALETAFQTFEIANASYVREGAQIVRQRMSDASIMVARVMLKKGYQPGQGLGKFLNGVTKMPSSIEKKDRCALGYQLTKADKKRFAEEKKEKRMARVENREPKTERIPICHILQSFRSAGLLFADQVATVGDRNDIDADQDTKWVIPCFPETNSPTGRSSNFL
ncbi:G-patch domain [Sesbania bispinosa]|nr:G-patch domain [Sesbania bispinosa]